MAIGDVKYNAHSVARLSQTYAAMRVKELLNDSFAQTFFTIQDGAALGKPGGMEFANAAVVDYTSALKTPMRGDSVIIDKGAQMHGKPTSGTLRNNEEKLNYGTQTITIARNRHAVGIERFGSEKAHFDQEADVRRVFRPWIQRWKDKRIFDAMISGRTAVFANSRGTRASAGIAAAGMASTGMTVADLDRIGLTLRARNAKPLFFSAGPNGGQLPGYAVVMPPDQYSDLIDESAMKSAFHLSVPTGENHPLRTDGMVKYKNLWIFSLAGDFRDGGSPLAPMGKLYANVGTASGASIVYLSTSGSAAAPTKYFPSSGFLTIYDMGSTKGELIKYTAKGDYYFTITAKRVAATRTSHLAAASMVRFDVQNVIAFGREVVAKVETINPEWIRELMDYAEVIGTGLRWIDGYAALTDTYSRTDGLFLTQCGGNNLINYF